MSYVSFLSGLPPRELWPERIYLTDDFNYPERLNAGAELLDRNLDRGFGERAAIYYKDESISYGELARRVGQMSNALKSLGAEQGDRIMIRFPNTPTAVALWLAIVRSGYVAVTIMPMLRSREISYRANDAECIRCRL